MGKRTQHGAHIKRDGDIAGDTDGGCMGGIPCFGGFATHPKACWGGKAEGSGCGGCSGGPGTDLPEKGQLEG